MNSGKVNMKHKYTHEGVVRGTDGRTPEGYHYKASLRETKRYWVTTGGTKFQKRDGRGIGDWPVYRLVVESIKPNADLTGNQKPGKEVEL